VSTDAREGRLGPALLVALLVASLIAGVLVYRARTADLALEVPRIDRLLGVGGEAKMPVELEFFVRFDEPNAQVEIVGKGDEPVRTFGEDVALAADERIECEWDGLDDAGDPVPPGAYRLRVVLPEQDRDMVFPLRILVRQQAEPDEGSSAALEGPSCVRAESGEALG
jgi:hypothetical protein